MINHKDLILGTSLWGWTVKKKECFKILDTFYNNGYRWIDTATNYPINSDIKYFRYAENLIAEWIKNNDRFKYRVKNKTGNPPQLKQTLTAKQLTAIAESYNRTLFDEIRKK